MFDLIPFCVSAVYDALGFDSICLQIDHRQYYTCFQFGLWSLGTLHKSDDSFWLGRKPLYPQRLGHSPNTIYLKALKKSLINRCQGSPEKEKSTSDPRKE